jgi:hypothetical protein
VVKSISVLSTIRLFFGDGLRDYLRPKAEEQAPPRSGNTELLKMCGAAARSAGNARRGMRQDLFTGRAKLAPTAPI